ncbi:hypothetical protein BUALT_Bualt12G0135800 [Buddleja alternifolia]|uniref:DUF8040 domain-containing protein n=1 Tax=Buddleja alternifolia TaxID=168488 RepID=A0AAV6X1T0_9LAMI|nr:hypothetical protein BUALT_Bualt12G0135800 [Buddleja alternifolia]
MLVVQEIISNCKFFMNIIVAPLSDERLGCRPHRKHIVRYVMAQRIPDQVSRIHRLTGNNDTDCLDNLRMNMGTFPSLCYLLHNIGGLSDSKYVKLEEKLHPILLVTPKPLDYEYNAATWKSFKGCLGALDDIVDSNVDFAYMLPGWERSAVDGRVLRNAVNRPNGLKVPNGGLSDSKYVKLEEKLHPIILATPKPVDDECNVARWKIFKDGSTVDGKVLRDAVNRPNGLKVSNG